MQSARATCPRKNGSAIFLPGVTVEDRLLLRAALKQLSDAERQIVMLHAVAGLRHRETAALLELPLATVLSKYARAVKKLKYAMEADGR